jgi:hypothetical protein
MYVDLIAKRFFKLVRSISLFSLTVAAISGISATTSMRCSNIYRSIGSSFEASGSVYILKALSINGCIGDDRRGNNFYLTTESAHCCPYEVNRPVER